MRQPPAEYAKSAMTIFGGSVKVLLPLLMEIHTPPSPNPTMSPLLSPVTSATRRGCLEVSHPPAFCPKFLTTRKDWTLETLRRITTPSRPNPTIPARPGLVVCTRDYPESVELCNVASRTRQVLGDHVAGHLESSLIRVK